VAVARSIIRRRAERELARQYVPAGLAARLGHPLRTLSGGNRQRVLVARLVAAGAEVLLLSNLAVGVDVNGRSRFRVDVRALADRGKAVLIYSSEPEELLGLADRVLAFEGGRIRAVLSGAGLTEARLLEVTLMARPATG
jgi:ribose transport system ATP-binding protein